MLINLFHSFINIANELVKDRHVLYNVCWASTRN